MRTGWGAEAGRGPGEFGRPLGRGDRPLGGRGREAFAPLPGPRGGFFILVDLVEGAAAERPRKLLHLLQWSTNGAKGEVRREKGVRTLRKVEKALFVVARKLRYWTSGLKKRLFASS